MRIAEASIAVVTYGGGHVNMVIPVVRELIAAGARVTVLGLTTAASALARAGIPHIGYQDLLQPDDHDARAWGERLAPAMVGGDVARDESVAYLGLGYADLVRRHGPAEAARLYAERGRQAFFPVSVLERWLSGLKPDLLLATNSPRSERAAIEVAGSLGIRAVCVVDLYALQEVAWIGRQGFATRVCVLSEHVKAMMLRAGRRAEEIVVTGNPVFDRLASPALAAQAQDVRARRGWGDERVILWASQPEPALHPFTGAPADPTLPRRIDAALFATVAAHPRWRLVVRMHPSEPAIVGTLPERCESGAGEELAPLVAAVDAVVTMTSTVGLEAALLGKPVVAVGMSVFTSDAPYAQMGLAMGVDRLETLEPALAEVLDRGGWKPTCALPPLGEATANVVAVITEVLASALPSDRAGVRSPSGASGVST